MYKKHFFLFYINVYINRQVEYISQKKEDEIDVKSLGHDAQLTLNLTFIFKYLNPACVILYFLGLNPQRPHSELYKCVESTQKIVLIEHFTHMLVRTIIAPIILYSTSLP